MLARSFRLVAALVPLRLIPGPRRAKQALLPLVAVILAGCGSSPQPKAQSVRGPGYRFAAPVGWQVKRTSAAVTAADGADLVQVSTFALTKAYRPPLFARVGPELQRQLERAAASVGGKVERAGDVTAAGIRSHVYRVRVGDHVDEYTFVLHDRREYQLLCRAATPGADACGQLQSTFALA